MKRVKKSRIALDKIYSERSKIFLSKEENSVCPLTGGVADTVHHAWRRGRYYLDESTWLGMSLEGNLWVEANKNEARARGWLCDNAETRARWRQNHGGFPLS
jgi:hypothetical protein